MDCPSTIIWRRWLRRRGADEVHRRCFFDSEEGLGGDHRCLNGLRDELAATADKNSSYDIPCKLVVEYVVGAYRAVMTWWLDGGARLPPHRMDAMFVAWRRRRS